MRHAYSADTNRIRRNDYILSSVFFQGMNGAYELRHERAPPCMLSL